MIPSSVSQRVDLLGLKKDPTKPLDRADHLKQDEIYTHQKDYSEHLFNFSLMQLSNQPITWQLPQCI